MSARLSMVPSRLPAGWARLAMAAGATAVLAATPAAASTAAPDTAALAARTTFTPDEVAQILQHGPWPPRRLPDASNRVGASARAATFGQRHQMVVHGVRQAQLCIQAGRAMREASLRKRQPIPRDAIHGGEGEPFQRCF